MSNFLISFDREMILKLQMLKLLDLLSYKMQKTKQKKKQTERIMKRLLSKQKDLVFIEKEDLVDLGDHLRGSGIKKGNKTQMLLATIQIQHLMFQTEEWRNDKNVADHKRLCFC